MSVSNLNPECFSLSLFPVGYIYWLVWGVCHFFRTFDSCNLKSSTVKERIIWIHSDVNGNLETKWQWPHENNLANTWGKHLTIENVFCVVVVKLLLLLFVWMLYYSLFFKTTKLCCLVVGSVSRKWPSKLLVYTTAKLLDSVCLTHQCIYPASVSFTS